MIMRLIKSVLRRFGVGTYKLRRQGAEKHRAELGNVDILVDVGVAKGTPWLYKAFPSSELILIDPIRASEKFLRHIGSRPYEFIECALGSEEGKVTINQDIDQPSRSSILDRTALTQTNHAYQQVEVPLKRLDNVISNNVKDGKTIGLKIDTEGFELEILKGSENILSNCKFIICEASIAKRFEGSYDFEELVCFLKDRDFRVHSLLTADRDKDGIIRFVDIVFVKKDA